MPLAEWNNRNMLNHFSIVRKLDGGVFPMGFTSEVSKINSNAGSNILSSEGRLACSFREFNKDTRPVLQVMNCLCRQMLLLVWRLLSYMLLVSID
jgi:hypothetical protein